MRIALIVLAALIAAAPAEARLPTESVQIASGYMSGNRYRDLSSGAKVGYVMGVIDGILLSPFFGAEAKDMVPVVDCIKGVRGDQMRAIVDNFLGRHPERWDEAMQVLIFFALYDACKARGKLLGAW